MTDIVHRLAQWAENDMPAEDVALAAKHEIERLRAALEWAAVQLGNNNLPAFAHQVRAVLGGEG